MATQFQNRLIGTVILFSLGIAFLPDLLMGKKNDIAAPPGSIPLKPEQTVANVTTNLPPVASASTASNTNKPADLAVISNKENGSSVIVVGDGKSEAETVQSVVSSNNHTAAQPVISSVQTPSKNSTKEEWSVEDVAPTVTISQSDASTAQSEQAALLKAKQDKQKKDQEAALKKAQLAKQERLAKQKAEQERLLAEKKLAQQSVETQPETAAPVSESANVPTQSSQVTQTTVNAKVEQDDSGLTIKTPAQVEAERLQRTQKAASTTLPAKTNTAVNTQTIAPKPQTGSWIIQLGVFSNAENAKSLAARLRSAGYVASTQRVGTLTRVVVGPDTSKAKLQSQLASINSVGGTAGKVIPYSAVNN